MAEHKPPHDQTDDGRSGTGAATNDSADLEHRRRALDQALARKAVSRDAADGTEEHNRAGSGFGAALKLSSEFIGGVLVGAGLGFLLDEFAGTRPWGLIVFLLLGFCAGVLNVLRAAGKVAEPHAVGVRDGAQSRDKNGSPGA